MNIDLLNFAHHDKTNSFIDSILSDVSDHFGFFHLETSYLKKQLQTPMLKRTYSELNIDKFNNMLTATNFEDVLDMNGPELAYSLFMDKYKYCFNECFPEKLTKLKMNKKYVKKEPWMTDDIMIMLKEKSKLYCKKNKNASAENITNYKLYLQTYNNTIRQAKHNYFRQKLDDNKDHVKKHLENFKKFNKQRK